MFLGYYALVQKKISSNDSMCRYVCIRKHGTTAYILRARSNVHRILDFSDHQDVIYTEYLRVKKKQGWTVTEDI